jgi:hypothetical protein
LSAVVSGDSQKARSSASFANSGIAFKRLGIQRPLLPVHCSGRNGTNQCVVLPQCKCDMQPPRSIGSSQSMTVRLFPAVLCVGSDDERLTKENLLHFHLCYGVLLILARVSIIPVESENLRQIHLRTMYVSGIYRQPVTRHGNVIPATRSRFPDALARMEFCLQLFSRVDLCALEFV